jgi:hypothetical protein
MKVIKTNETGYRFWVESSDDKEPYLVDLTANKGLPCLHLPRQHVSLPTQAEHFSKDCSTLLP